MDNKSEAFNQSHSRSAATDFKGLPTRVKTVFELMIKEPLLRKHIILNGPPGSGKTSSAKLFVETLHGNDSWNGTFSKSLFLNSSDERGLEAVRSRVYPFYVLIYMYYSVIKMKKINPKLLFLMKQKL